MKKKEASVHIILLNYNGYEDTVECIKSICKINYNNYKIILVDNNSSDGSQIELLKYLSQNEKVHFIQSEKNLGFSGGNNIGIKQSTGEFIALLNPDTILLNNAFKIIIENMNKHKKIGPCGATLYNEHYELTMSHGCFPGWKENSAGS